MTNQISPDTVDALRAKLGTFSKDELIGELIGALIELASPRGSAIKPIGCMRPVCPHTEKCAEAWKCLNPIHSDRSDHGVVRPIDDSVPRSGSNGGLGHHQQMKSTQAMRDRIRELMQREQDDYDRAVECVLDDLEGMLGSAQNPVMPAKLTGELACIIECCDPPEHQMDEAVERLIFDYQPMWDRLRAALVSLQHQGGK